MRALILQEPGQLRAATMLPPSSDLPPGMARVDVRRIGVCGTDFHAWRGRQPFFTYPRILGHELGVVVAAVGEGVTHVSAGDRCAVEPYLFCGRCDACRRGRGNCCERLQVLGVHVDGGMREQIVVPADRLHPSTTLDLDRLALVETLSIGAHAVRRAAIGPGETVLVAGAGPIGLSAAAFAKLAGAQVVILDVDENRRRFAHEWLLLETVTSDPAGGGRVTTPGGRNRDVPTPGGRDKDAPTPGGRDKDAPTTGGRDRDAPTTGGRDKDAPTTGGRDFSPAIEDARGDTASAVSGSGASTVRGAAAPAPAEPDLERRIRDHFGGRLPVVVMDATGSAASMQRSFSFTGHGGRLVFVGLVQGDITFHDPELHRRELTLLASRNAQAEDFARVLQALESGTLDVSSWITHRAELDRVPAVFPSWTQPASGVVKAIIELN